jgi:hypothetical protein
MPDRPATGSGAAPAPDLETDLLRALRGDAAATPNAFDRRSSLANMFSRSQMPAWKSLLRLDPEGTMTPSILRLTWLCGCALAAAALFYGVWTFLNVIKELPLKYLFDPIAIFIACVVGVVFLLLNLRLWLELCLNIHRRSAP